MMLTLTAWALSVDIWLVKVVQNLRESELKQHRSTLILCLYVSNNLKTIYMDKLEKLLNQVQVYVNEDKQHRAEAFRRGECYNVFDVLGVYSQELSHSAFIAALLNPHGSHGMQDAFLKAFIDTIAHGGTQPEMDTAHAKVYTEYNIGNTTDTTGGRIDILITDRNDVDGTPGGHAIIIENKIGAADQPNQLMRYHNFAPKAALLYLTLNGDEPSEQSRDGLNAQSGDYQCISYRNDIIGWLRQCAQLSFDKPRVRETINQYINLLQQLTNQNTMEQKQLIQLLTNKDNFEQACAIADTMPAAKQYLVETTLRVQLKDDRYEITDCTYDRGNYGGISLRPQGWEHCIIKFEFERYNGTTDLCYGILDEHKPFMEVPRQDGYQQNDAWLVWNYMPQYRYWDNATFFAICSDNAVACEFKSRIDELLTLVATNHWQL